MYKHIVLTVLLWGIMSGCNSPSDGGGLEVRLEYQKASETSVYMMPVLHLQNQGSEAVYVYFKPYGYHSVIDTLTETIELNFVERVMTSPEGYEFAPPYDFPYPVILQIDPNAEIKVHADVITPPSTWELIKSEYCVFATVGYFNEEGMFFGKTQYELRESMLEFQNTASSPKVVLSDFFKAP